MNNSYSPSEFIKNIYYWIMTKLTIHQARFVRRPIYIRGSKSLKGASNLTTGRFCRFDLDGEKPTLFIGENCDMGDMTHIVAHEKVVIGDNVLMASKVFISDTNHGNINSFSSQKSIAPKKRPLSTSPVLIGDNVWIGENAVILAGAEIGAGSIIGANALVSKQIPAYSIVINSNQILRHYN